jgi:[acyl-carrier-protein] S-malonyltransferase
MGLDEARIRELCQAVEQAGLLAVALHNSPGQFVLSGAHAALERFKPLALSAGARECVMLQVSHAFHSPLMGQILEEWRAVVAAIPLRMPRYPVVLNTTARTVKTLVCIRRSMVDQLISPVLWVQCVQALVGMGVSRVLEVGDSKVVSSLARRTEPSLRAETMETFFGQGW